jgi:hypothetical protein
VKGRPKGGGAATHTFIETSGLILAGSPGTCTSDLKQERKEARVTQSVELTDRALTMSCFHLMVKNTQIEAIWLKRQKKKTLIQRKKIIVK